MGLTPAVCTSFLLAVFLFSATLDCAETSCVSKQHMCDSLRSLAGCTSDNSCTTNSDCTCISFTAVIADMITIPLTICIVDPCATPVCFNLTSESLFSEIVCNTTTIKFTTSKTIPFFGTIPVPASITVGLVPMPPSCVEITMTATVAPHTRPLGMATVCFYCTPPLCPSLEDMCDSVRNLAMVFNTSDTVTGNCTISETCLEMNCDLKIQLAIATLPMDLSVTFLPCRFSFAISVKAVVTVFGQKVPIIDGNFSRTTTFSVEGLPFSGTVTVAITQQHQGILISVTGDFGSSALFILIESANIIMYCNTTSMPLALPAKNASLADMCTSVTELTDVLSNGDTVTGTCNISDTCLGVNCNLKVTLMLNSLPVNLLINLLPCKSPFAIYVKVDAIVFGKAIPIIDDIYSASEIILIDLSPSKGTLNVDIIQEDCGITLSVSGEFPIFGHFSLIENATIAMHCPCP